jgi:hypothetical protein
LIESYFDLEMSIIRFSSSFKLRLQLSNSAFLMIMINRVFGCSISAASYQLSNSISHGISRSAFSPHKPTIRYRYTAIA